MEETNWNIASNTQLEEEINRLVNVYEEKKNVMLEIHNEMVELSNKYNELSEILNKRKGKTK